MRWNFEKRKKRQKAVTEKIIETRRKKPSITLPSLHTPVTGEYVDEDGVVKLTNLKDEKK